MEMKPTERNSPVFYVLAGCICTCMYIPAGCLPLNWISLDGQLCRRCACSPFIVLIIFAVCIVLFAGWHSSGYMGNWIKLGQVHSPPRNISWRWMAWRDGGVCVCWKNEMVNHWFIFWRNCQILKVFRTLTSVAVYLVLCPCQEGALWNRTESVTTRSGVYRIFP